LCDDQELLQSESTFQKSLSNISAESSNAAVEVASLKAMLQVEQSKVGWLDGMGCTSRTQTRVAGCRNFRENLKKWWISISELLHLGLVVYHQIPFKLFESWKTSKNGKVNITPILDQ